MFLYLLVQNNVTLRRYFSEVKQTRKAECVSLLLPALLIVLSPGLMDGNLGDFAFLIDSQILSIKTPFQVDDENTLIIYFEL